MHIGKSGDLRVQRTMAAIGRAFSELLLESGYERMTVTALCARAGINKKTFYTYFRTLDGLLEAMLEELSAGFVERIAHLKVPEQLADINREFFRYSAEQGAFYEKLVCSASLHPVGGKLLSEFVKRAWQGSDGFQKLDEARQNVLLCFLHSCGMGLYRQWVADGKRVPIEEMAAVSGELLCRGVDGFLAHGGASG